MTFRPRSARWFELLTPREDLTTVLECLAGTGSVELQAHSEAPNPLRIPGLKAVLEEFAELSGRYSAYWPRAILRAGAHRSRAPGRILEEAMSALSGWSAEADPVIRELQSFESERTDLALLESLIGKGADSLPDGHLLARAGPVLGSAVFVMPEDAWPDAVPASVITQRLVIDSRVFLVAVGPKADLDPLCSTVIALKGREVALPAWLPGDGEGAEQAIADRIAEIDRNRTALESELARLSKARDLPDVLGDLRLMEWLAENVPAMPATERFAWVTGWTSDADGHSLRGSLAEANIEHLLRFVEPPAGFDPPMILANPGWIRPFELFARLLGTPGSGEADPTLIVAIVAPLLFGFMFGDVGHGGVILVAGLVLRRRYPALGILVAGGILSMIFGVLFGSIFAREDVFPALWLHPFDQPMTVLLVSLLIGAAVLFVGLGLAALQTYWTGGGLHWWRSRAGLPLAYAGLVGALFDLEFLWLTLSGIAWIMLGGLAGRKRRDRASKELSESFETFFQLIINTISFVRVGAFALAHSGLSAAVVGIAAGVDSLAATVLILGVGNAFIIVLEGLVVGIQTTRLVLFEFFVRFLTATGRQFLPLPAPDVALYQGKEETT